MNNTKHILPEEFCIERYGVVCRLIQESDADFIVHLRNSTRQSKHLHKVGSVEDQIQWIRDYKQRERQGFDFYFIFFKDGQPIGLSRIYNVDWARLSYTPGSWINVPGIPFDVSLIPVVILDDIRRALGLIVGIYDVRKDNAQVLRFHRNIRCAYEYGETNRDILFMTTPETRKKSKLRKLLSLPHYEEMPPISIIEEIFDY